MPWKTTADAKRHKKDLSDGEAKAWIKIANNAYDACMKKGGDDKTCAPKAIQIASGTVNRNRGAKQDLEWTGAVWDETELAVADLGDSLNLDPFQGPPIPTDSATAEKE